MHWPGELARRIRMLLHRKQVTRDIQQEITLHLDLLRQQQIDAGVPPKDAAAAAHRHFGNATLVQERTYLAAGWE